jgi:hypothetical protein
MPDPNDSMMDRALDAYEQSTGQEPDTRDFVALQDAVKNYEDELDGSK